MPNKWLWASLLWTIGVAVLCMVNGSEFERVSWFNIPYKDKYVHFSFYFGFTVLWYLYFTSRFTGNGKRIRGMVFAMAVVYGIIIEICQGLLTTGRSADILDALANTAGSATAVLALWLLRKKLNNK